MGSGIATAGHIGATRGPGKAPKNTTGVVFEPFQRVLEHRGRLGSLRNTISLDPDLLELSGTLFWSIQSLLEPSNTLFLTIQRLLEPSRTLFLSIQRLLEPSRALILSIRGLLNLSRTKPCSSIASNMIVDAAKTERLKR